MRSYQRTYGKAQAANPGRWLTRDQAFGALVAACQDGTLPGLRDELIVRLGLTGLRCSEIAGITVGAFSQPPQITWTGKRSKPRRAVAGATLLAVLDPLPAVLSGLPAVLAVDLRYPAGEFRSGWTGSAAVGHGAASPLRVPGGAEAGGDGRAGSCGAS